MKMPPPIVKDMSCILVSKRRLIAVLGHLRFLDDSIDGQNLLSMIDALWQEAHEYTNGNVDLMTTGSNDSNYNAVGKRDEDSNGTASMRHERDSDSVSDLIQLGTLKWILYGFPAKQPSWFSSFCMPCGMTPSEKALQQRQDKNAQQEHPVKTSCMKRRHGELVRHDVMKCKLCRTATGCSEGEAEIVGEEAASETSSDHLMPFSMPIASQRSSSLGAREAGNLSTADDESYVDSTCESVVEVSTIASLMTGEMQTGLLEKTEEAVRI